MGEWVCLERPNGCHPGSLEGRVSYGRRTTCASFLRRTYDVYTSFLWATYTSAHDAGRLASVPQGWQHPGHPSTSERNLASFPRISFPHSLLPSFFNLIPIIISPAILVLQPLYSSSWSSPQCDQHLWMITADLLLGSELQAMQNQFILLRCHPASRFISITSIEIIIINTFYTANIKWLWII